MRKKILIKMTILSLTILILGGCASKTASIEETEQAETAESTELQTTEETSTTETVESNEAEPTEELLTEPEAAESSEEEPTIESEAELTAAAEPTEDPTVQYTYTDLSATMYAQQNVNVRNQPSTDGEKVGSLSTNQEVSVTGQCNETSWYRIDYNGAIAYVSNNYIADNQVEAAQSNSDTSGGTKNSSNPCPYTLWEYIDYGDSIGWYVVQPVDTDEHLAKWRAIGDILYERAKAKSNNFTSGEQTVWEFIGTYDEGNVYYQVLSNIYY